MRPRVVIIGGGFGGLEAARTLKKAPVEVLLIDKRNHHLFQPLLYQVATAGLSAPDIAAPIRKVLRKQDNVTVLLAEVVGIDREAKAVVLEDGSREPYNYLIVAAGATHSYFGNDHWQKHAPGLKTLHEALDIRRRVLLAYETAERELDADRRQPWLTFVVIGGGPTGVETAGALAEIAERTMARNFRRFDPGNARVLLVEGADRVLLPYPEELSESAKQQLEKLGVEVMLESMVADVDETGVTLRSGEKIEARTVVWAAGVQGSELSEKLGGETTRGRRLKIDETLTVAGSPHHYAIGDMVHWEQDGKKYGGVAPLAIQMGEHAAKNVVRHLNAEALQPFRYVDKGSMATIGRSKAVAYTGKLRLSGFIAWCAWLFIHILFLIGFRNRVMVMMEWAFAYITYQRGARVILEEPVTDAGDTAPPPDPEQLVAPSSP